ncbi:uncharacterized protein MICPUCDRAFT_68787 [Micromonas pusilla CCMP1545]|uniref:Predicted protein n=1 Tax=Micromonas pusilla (strain CCMP1545) TaxID=564608 RepID=C1N404_MICPC|nr:uncharacterized protein MICPUCDRAFT_68787 [Micromonas pusilla CCMP1545]EEH53526.1 predicted protein [Micromonas pusilla CCMP1545]|eukprot:XP_003062707.1 predicted protein [Micromonas pusilla CCMP1545]
MGGSGYAGYAPGHKVVMATPLQQALKAVKDDKSLETMEKLTRNSAQAPAEEKFRRVRLTNEKIAAVITNVPGAVRVMLEMGWRLVENDEFLILPTGTSVTMKDVREIDDARRALRKLEDEEMKRRIAARNRARQDPEKARLLAQMEADKAERAAKGPVTAGSVAVPRGEGRMMTAEQAGASGSSGGGG